MRHIIKDDKDKTEKLASEETYESLCNIVATGNKTLISDKIYRESYNTPDGKGSIVEDHLAKSYKHKCAYCERICKADIEHYRPKKKVDDEKDHPGYYWLCYEWTNLIPSCITCNRDGAKHNKFPILGKRVSTPPLLANGKLNLNLCKANLPPLINEIPYLLHPEVDIPENYFEFDIDPEGKGIRIIGIDDEGRGNKTIEICLLNRVELRLDRVERVIDDLKSAIECLVERLANNAISNGEFVSKIKDVLLVLKRNSENDEKTHTLLRKYIIKSSENFQKIVIPYLDVKIRTMVIEAYKAVFI